MQKNILITGGAGFIGSNFIPYFLDKYKDYNIINLDLLTYAGNLENLKECENNPRYKFIKGNICNRELVEFIFNAYSIQGVIHFAAESHVGNSIKDPSVFMQTNINGTFTLLDVAYEYWMNKPFGYRETYVIAAGFITYPQMKLMVAWVILDYLVRALHMHQIRHIQHQKQVVI